METDKGQTSNSCTFTKLKIIIIKIIILYSRYVNPLIKLTSKVLTDGQIYEIPLISCYKSLAFCNNAFGINWESDNTNINNKIINLNNEFSNLLYNLGSCFYSYDFHSIMLTRQHVAAAAIAYQRS